MADQGQGSDQTNVPPPAVQPPAAPPTPPPVAAPAAKSFMAPLTPPAPYTPEMGNNSGQGPVTAVPPELAGFNWGALLLSWIWSIGHQAWLGLAITLGPGLLGGMLRHGVPFLGSLFSLAGLAGAIYQGLHGNEWAWQNRRWDSLQQFKDTQRVWMIWGLILAALGVVGIVISLIVAAAVGAAALHAMSH